MATATGTALLPLVRRLRKVHPAGRILVEDRAREVSMDRRAKAAETTAGAAQRPAQMTDTASSRASSAAGGNRTLRKR